MYAILRTAKLSTKGNIAASLAHAFRTRETPNADHKLTPENSIDFDFAQNPDDALAMLDKRLATVKTVRKNAVLVIEYLITHSPEYRENNKYFSDALNWIKERHGAENVIASVIHRDETTPHLSVFVVPIDKNGKLNARQYLGGRQKLSEMQTDFAEKVGKKYGLKRGIERSGAKHTTIKEFYARVQEPVPEIKTKVPKVYPPKFSERLLESVGIQTEHSKQQAKAELAKKKRNEEIKARNASLIAKAKATDIENERRKQRESLLVATQEELKATKTALEISKKERQELANRLREIPIIDVLQRLGATRDKRDATKWHTEAGEVVAGKGEKSQHFNSFERSEIKGRGAIDLVVKIHGTDFQGAIAWLSKEFGAEKAVATHTAHARQQAIETIESIKDKPAPSLIPEQEPKHWQHVRKWLTEVRRLPCVIVDKLHAAGRLFADKFKNAVFLSKNGKSAEVVGTGEHRFKGFRGSKEDMFTAGRFEKNCTVAITESAIDGLSLFATGKVDAVISTGGTPTLGQLEKISLLKQEATLIAAFDNDAAGEEFTKHAKAQGIDKHIKPIHKDWNDDLRAGVQADIERQLEAQKQISKDQSQSMSFSP
jgi:DNA primase